MQARISGSIFFFSLLLLPSCVYFIYPFFFAPRPGHMVLFCLSPSDLSQITRVYKTRRPSPRLGSPRPGHPKEPTPSRLPGHARDDCDSSPSSSSSPSPLGRSRPARFELSELVHGTGLTFFIPPQGDWTGSGSGSYRVITVSYHIISTASPGPLFLPFPCASTSSAKLSAGVGSHYI